MEEILNSLAFPIDKKLTEEAKEEIGTPHSRVFLTVGYNVKYIESENGEMINKPIIKEKPEIIGVHKTFDSVQEAEDYVEEELMSFYSLWENRRVSETFDDIWTYLSLILLENASGVVSEYYIKPIAIFELNEL